MLAVACIAAYPFIIAMQAILAGVAVFVYAFIIGEWIYGLIKKR